MMNLQFHGRRCYFPLPLLALSLLLLTSCVRSAPVSYYQLSAVAGNPSGAGSAPPMLGIGPLTLPSYLDRPQIVTRTSANQLDLADTHRWAEPLADNINRVLLENLLQRFPGSQLHLYPWRHSQAVDLQLVVDILQFETDEAGIAHLEIQWTVLDKNGSAKMPEKVSSYAVPAAQSDEGSRTMALSATLGLFCSDVATQLIALLPHEAKQ